MPSSRRSLGSLGSLSIAAILLWTARLCAQYTTASLGGTVEDPSGAAVPDAQVTVRNSGTGLTQTQLTGADGAFLFPRLPLGETELTVERSGFLTYIQKGIVLTVNQTATLTVVLQLGAVSQAVTVTANAQLVETRTGTVGQLVDERRVVDLPLNGRTPQELVFLAAGTFNSTRRINTGHGGVYPGEQFASVNGVLPNTTYYQMDGASYNDTYINTNLPFPNPDAIQEFNLRSANYSAEYENAASGVVNVVTKSGTNEFHGDAFEFLRNGAANARNFFAPKPDTLKRNQFGGSFGGPILKSKLFIFGSYQGTRTRESPQGRLAFVPTVAQRGGDFSGLSNQLNDPVTGLPFANNRIPSSRLSTPAQNVLKFVPLPNGAGGSLTFALPNIMETEDQFLIKPDYSMRKHQLSGHYYYTFFRRPPAVFENNLLSASGGNVVRVQSIAAQDTYVYSPTLLFNTSYAWDLQTGGSRSAAPFGFPDLGIKVAAPTPPELVLTVGGFFSVNTNHLGDFDRGDYTIRENVAWTRGTHELHFGGSIVRLKNEITNTFSQAGSFTFSGKLSGDNLADFLLGRASSFAEGGGEFKSLRGTRLGFFAQDNWRFSRRLTLNLGVRWDPYTPPQEIKGRTVCFRPGSKSTRFPNAPAGMIFGGGGGATQDNGCPEAGIPNDLNNVAPRLGFAYQLTSDSKTVIRGGAGFFYMTPSTSELNGFANAAPFAPRFVFTNVDFTDPFGSQGVANPFPAQFAPTFTPSRDVAFTLPLALQAVFPVSYQIPLLTTWNLTLERQFGVNWRATFAYVGNHAAFLEDTTFEPAEEDNPAIFIPGTDASGKLLSTTANTQSRRIFKQFSQINSRCACQSSNYNSFQATLEKRFSKGLSILTNYTWGKSIDDLGQDNPFNRHAVDYGRSNDDIRNRWTLSGIWMIPTFGTSAKGWLGHLANGWEVAPILTWRSGLPLTIRSGVDNSRSGVNRDHADFVGTDLNQAKLDPGRSHGQLVAQFFNTSVFRSNATGTFGNAGKNIIEARGAFNADVAIIKMTKITERVSSQARVEFFNAFNNVNFNPPGTTVGQQTTFGRITSAADPRIMQFALKILF